MKIELSEKEIEIISACLLAMILYMEQSDNDNDKAKQFKNDVCKIYGSFLKLSAEKDHKNEN